MKWVWFAVIVVVLFVTALFVMPIDEHSALYKPVQTVKAAIAPPREIKIIVVGDMLFDRTIRRAMERNGDDYVLSCVADFLASADFVLGNLEGPITAYPSVSLGSEIGSPANFTFTMPTSTATLLARHGVTLVNLSNNHIGNFGREGLASTREYLDVAGVRHFGGLSGDEPIYVLEHGAHDIAFISYNAFGGDDVAEVAEKIIAQKAAENFVVVYAHWGDEYAEDVSSMQTEATVLAEAGADAIFGSHPHVVLPSGYIGDTLVYYSLGNFVFDQYWNERVRTGLALSVTFRRDGQLDIEEVPVEMLRDGRTCVQQVKN